MKKLIVYVGTNKPIYDLNEALERECDLIPFTVSRGGRKEPTICNNLYVTKSDKNIVDIILDFEKISSSELFKNSLTVLVFDQERMENVTPILFLNDKNCFKRLEEDLFEPIPVK